MNFVKDGELVCVLFDVKLWLTQFGSIGIGLEIKIDRLALLRDCKRCLPNLARSNERDGGVAINEFL